MHDTPRLAVRARHEDSAGGIVVRLRCALCSAESHDIGLASWNEAHGNILPVGWVHLEVTIPQAVLPKDAEGLADAMRSMTGLHNPAVAGYAEGMCQWLEDNSPSFHDDLYVCPDCVAAGVTPWAEIQRRLVRAVERDIEDGYPKRTGPQGVLPFVLHPPPELPSALREALEGLDEGPREVPEAEEDDADVLPEEP